MAAATQRTCATSEQGVLRTTLTSSFSPAILGSTSYSPYPHLQSDKWRLQNPEDLSKVTDLSDEGNQTKWSYLVLTKYQQQNSLQSGGCSFPASPRSTTSSTILDSEEVILPRKQPMREDKYTPSRGTHPGLGMLSDVHSIGRQPPSPKSLQPRLTLTVLLPH